MRERTIVLVSHHVQLCAPGAKYIVALDNGQLRYKGDYRSFIGSEAFKALVQTDAGHGHDHDHAEAGKDTANEVEAVAEKALDSNGLPQQNEQESKKKVPRKLIEDEKRATGHIDRAIWAAYLSAYGGLGYWLVFIIILGLAAVSPVVENGWLKCDTLILRRTK